jgi:hypothetical protein
VIILYFRCKYNYYLFSWLFFPPNRISFASTISDNAVCSYIVLIDTALTCYISFCFGHWGGSMEYCWCSVGSANWIYKVVFWFYPLFIIISSPQCIIIQSIKWFCRVQSWRTLPIEYFLVMHALAAFLSLIEIYGNGRGQDAWRNFYSGYLCSSVPLIGLL